MVIRMRAYYTSKYSDHIFSLKSTPEKQYTCELVKQLEFMKLHLWSVIVNITYYSTLWVLNNCKSFTPESQSLKNKKKGWFTYKTLMVKFWLKYRSHYCKKIKVLIFPIRQKLTKTAKCKGSALLRLMSHGNTMFYKHLSITLVPQKLDD